MGLLKSLLLLPAAPVAAPVSGLVWLARTLQEIAEEELDDPSALRARLAEAEDAHRAGEIDDAELAAIEDTVLARLVQVNVIDDEGTWDE